MLMISAESRLLMLTAGGSRNDAQIAQLTAGPVRWERALALAEIERAMPVFARRICAVGAEGGALSSDVAATLWHHSQVAAFRMSHLASRLGETLDSLAAADVDVMLLKGAAVAASVHRGLDERPMADLDLLVRRSDEVRAVACAMEAGWRAAPRDASAAIYREHHHLAPMLDQTDAGLALELHRDVLPPGHPFGLTAERMWSRGQQREFHGRPVTVPHPVDQLLHACIHFAWGHMMGAGGGIWRTVRDVSGLLGRGGVEWAELVEGARAVRAESCCFWTLSLGAAFQALDVPGEVLRVLRPRVPGVVERALQRHLLHQVLPSEGACPSVRLRRRMWELAIQPRRSGHGAARPWGRSAEWREFAGTDVPGSSSPATGPSWLRYSRAVFGR
jgi:hypothetical protein